MHAMFKKVYFVAKKRIHRNHANHTSTDSFELDVGMLKSLHKYMHCYDK